MSDSFYRLMFLEREMVKRSPRYPRHNLAKSIEMARRLFAGAHQAKIDVDSAAKVIGYAGSGGGAATSALGALRQFGLVDGLRGDVAVSELAMRIIQPMDEAERVGALHEAAMKPEVFSSIVNQFGGRLPASDDPIRSFLIRQEGFSASGAEEVIQALRETISSLPEKHGDTPTGPRPEEAQESDDEEGRSNVPVANAPKPSDAIGVGELITLPLGQNCKAELRLIGEVTSSSYARLIRHLELLRDIASEEGE